MEIEPYTRKENPKLFNRFGGTFVKNRINPFIRKCAATLAIMQDGEKCNYVEVSDNYTSKDVVVAFADFSDGRRLWIAEDNFDHPVEDRWKDRHLLSNQSANIVTAFKVAYG